MHAVIPYLQRKEDIPLIGTCLNAGCEQQFDMTIVGISSSLYMGAVIH